MTSTHCLEVCWPTSIFTACNSLEENKTATFYGLKDGADVEIQIFKNESFITCFLQGELTLVDRLDNRWRCELSEVRLHDDQSASSNRHLFRRRGSLSSESDGTVAPCVGDVENDVVPVRQTSPPDDQGEGRRAHVMDFLNSGHVQPSLSPARDTRTAAQTVDGDTEAKPNPRTRRLRSSMAKAKAEAPHQIIRRSLRAEGVGSAKSRDLRGCHPCELCAKSFKTAASLRKHLGRCRDIAGHPRGGEPCLPVKIKKEDGTESSVSRLTRSRDETRETRSLAIRGTPGNTVARGASQGGSTQLCPYCSVSLDSVQRLRDHLTSEHAGEETVAEALAALKARLPLAEQGDDPVIANLTCPVCRCGQPSGAMLDHVRFCHRNEAPTDVEMEALMGIIGEDGAADFRRGDGSSGLAGSPVGDADEVSKVESIPRSPLDPDPLSCPYCGMNFREVRSMMNHLWLKHVDEGDFQAVILSKDDWFYACSTTRRSAVVSVCPYCRRDREGQTIVFHLRWCHRGEADCPATTARLKARVKNLRKRRTPPSLTARNASRGVGTEDTPGSGTLAGAESPPTGTSDGDDAEKTGNEQLEETNGEIGMVTEVDSKEGSEPLACPYCGAVLGQARSLMKHLWQKHSREQGFQDVTLSKDDWFYEAGTSRRSAVVSRCPYCSRHRQGQTIFFHLRWCHGAETDREAATAKIKSQLRIARSGQIPVQDSAAGMAGGDTATKAGNPLAGCPYCRKPFPENRALLRHIVSKHTTESTFDDVIRRTDQQIADRSKHIRSSIEVKCPFCACVRRGQSIFVHLRWCHSREATLSQKIILVKGRFLEERKTVMKASWKRFTGCSRRQGPPFVCRFCKEAFRARGPYYRHQRFLCPLNPKRTTLHECRFCGFVTPKQETMAAHLAVHKDQYVCDLCRKSYQYKSGLYYHKRTKHQLGRGPIKVFTCEVCKRVMHHRSQFTRHMLRHSDEKTHTCEFCGRLFKGYSDMRSHQRIAHFNLYRYRCDQCGHGVQKKGQLERHVCGRTRMRRREGAVHAQPDTDVAETSATGDPARDASLPWRRRRFAVPREKPRHKVMYPQDVTDFFKVTEEGVMEGHGRSSPDEGGRDVAKCDRREPGDDGGQSHADSTSPRVKPHIVIKPDGDDKEDHGTEGEGRVDLMSDPVEVQFLSDSPGGFGGQVDPASSVTAFNVRSYKGLEASTSGNRDSLGETPWASEVAAGSRSQGDPRVTKLVRDDMLKNDREPADPCNYVFPWLTDQSGTLSENDQSQPCLQVAGARSGYYRTHSESSHSTPLLTHDYPQQPHRLHPSLTPTVTHNVGEGEVFAGSVPQHGGPDSFMLTSHMSVCSGDNYTGGSVELDRQDR